MKKQTQMIALTVMTLALVAGTSSSAWAQSVKPDGTPITRNENDRKPERADGTLPAGVDFRSCHKLKGVDIVNESGENVGEVSDLVLDRGSGRIDYVVIKTGSVLNMAGKSVALPYGALRWNPGKDQFVLATTKDQLKQYPEFTAERWSAMMESQPKDSKQAKDQRNANDQAARNAREQRSVLPDSPSAANLYAGHYDASKPVRIEGEVTGVERFRNNSGDEEVIVTVATKDGQSRRVSLGPSWYVAGGTAAPMRGDKVVVDSYSVGGETNLYTASRARIGEREMVLRENNGDPTWSTTPSGGSYGRYVLASSVRGMKVECRGAECGKVNDVIVDRNSGDVALLSIDPNENFLGIADTKRLVPWTVANIAVGGVVRLDATKEMILASPETPSDVSMLNNSDRTKMVFDAYHVPMPSLDARKHAAMTPPQAGDPKDAWRADGPIAATVEHDSTRTLTGKIAGVTEIKFDNDVTPARALKVRTTDGDDVTVLLGPSWYVNGQANDYRPGESVTLDVCKAKVNGKSYWITKSMECDGKRVALWNNNRPAWDER